MLRWRGMTALSSPDVPKLGARNTRQRAAVVEVLRDLDKFTAAKDIHSQLIERGENVGLTTVYRTLQALSDVGAVDALHTPAGETVYRHCDSTVHHHHLVCTSCGHTEEIDGGPIESWAHQIAAEHGFQLTGHDAEIFGICSRCAAQVESRAQQQTPAAD